MIVLTHTPNKPLSRKTGSGGRQPIQNIIQTQGMTIFLNTPIVLTYGTLTLAIASLWLPTWIRSEFISQWAWAILLSIAIALGLNFGFLKPEALISFSLFIFSAYAVSQKTIDFRLKIVCNLLVIILAIALSLHILPGITNPKIISGLQLSQDALPYTKFLNFDSALIGLCLIGFGHKRLTTLTEWGKTLDRMAPIALMTLLTVMVMSLLLGYVHWQPKSTSLYWLWAWGNLFFTCVAEEAFFRGFIQKNLMFMLKRYKSGVGLAVFFASCLFGLAHHAGGSKYILLATVAGMGYGWAYAHTQRIEAAILTHFCLNSLHFALFTYPVVASAI